MAEEPVVISDADREYVRNGKVALLVTLGFVTAAASSAPWVLRRCLGKKAVGYINIGIALAAGIILGTYLSHTTPDANEQFATYMTATYDPEGTGENARLVAYPFAQMLSGAIFVLLVWIDRGIVVRGFGHGHGGADGAHVGHSHVAAGMQQLADGGAGAHEYAAPAAAAAATAGAGAAAAAAVSENEKKAIAEEAVVGVAIGDDVVGAKKESGGRRVATRSTSGGGGGGASTRAGRAPLAHAHGGDEEDPEPVEPAGGSGNQAAAASALVFFVALSIHAIFDGLSVGAETERDSFITTVIAVVAHKLFDGLAIGVPVFFAGFSPRVAAFIIVFCAAMTPLGIAIGLASVESVTGLQATLATAILKSMSGGSFLFISLAELLPSALEDGKAVNVRMAAFATGWALMAILAAWA